MGNRNCTDKEIKIVLSYLKGSRKISNDAVKVVTEYVGGKEISEEKAYEYFHRNYPKILIKQELTDFEKLLIRAHEYCNKYFIGF